MAEIPYFFETPVPKYFRENGWFECEHMFKFVTWAFSKCQNVPHKIVMQGKEIILQPFEFISGRLSSPKECFLTENIFRNQQLKMQKAGLLKKSTNSLTNHYSAYIWVTEDFCKTDNQQNNQPLTNRQPTVNHKSRIKKIRSKKSHPSIPSRCSDRDDAVIDDFSFEKEKREEEEKAREEVIPGVFLSKADLEKCIKIKGSIEKVREAIAFIQSSKKRKCEITDWPNALARWKIENKAEVRIEENIALAEKLAKQFARYEQGKGWRCYFYLDRKTDQKGLVFESQSAYKEAIFIALADGEFKEKCKEAVKNTIMS